VCVLRHQVLKPSGISFVPSFLRSFLFSFRHSFIHSLTHSLTHSLIRFYFRHLAHKKQTKHKRQRQTFSKYSATWHKQWHMLSTSDYHQDPSSRHLLRTPALLLVVRFLHNVTTTRNLHYQIRLCISRSSSLQCQSQERLPECETVDMQ